MKIFLTNQTENFQRHLNALKSVNVMQYDKTELKEKVSTIQIKVNSDVHNLDLDFFFNYKIFPDNILTFRTQWQDECRGMKIGDTILGNYLLNSPMTNCSYLVLMAINY